MYNLISFQHIIDFFSENSALSHEFSEFWGEIYKI